MGRVAAWGVPAVLLGGAACVSCTVTLVAAVAGALGAGAATGAGYPLGLAAVAAVVATGGAAFAVARLRKAEDACEIPVGRHPYLRFSARNAALGLLGAVAFVAGGALVAKAMFEGLLGLSYVVHWTTTVPALVAAFAWIFHGELNKSATGE